MDLRLFFIEQPQASTLALLDRKISGLARRQEPIDGGRRLWVTHVPETATRPFLEARPFDIRVAPVRLSAAETEDFRIGVGAAPTRCMVCRSADDESATLEVLFAIAAEVMSHCAALLEITDGVGRRMFPIDPWECDFPAQLLDTFPGTVYEIAHETDEGDLAMAWLVDARWVRAWIGRHAERPSATVSRFASLDYT